MLAAGGLHPGEELLSGEQDDYFEDAAFVGLHRKWLGSRFNGVVQRAPTDCHLDWGILDGSVPDDIGQEQAASSPCVADARHYARERERLHGRWLAKDPRASLFLDVWEQVEDVRFVLVYRSPWDVVDSAVRLGSPVFCRRPGIVRSAWLDHNLRILRFAVEHPDRCRVVAAEAVARAPELVWDEMRDWVGVSGAPPIGLIDTGRLVLRDDSSAIADVYRDVYPVHSALLAALDALACAPRPGSGGARTRTRRRPSAGGSLPPGTGVQVVIPCRNDGDFLVEAIASVDEQSGDRSDVELTVVDDGSTDFATERVMEALRESGRHVIRLSGVGLSAARNAGAATSRTLAVVPLDADNRLLPAMFDAVDLVERLGVDIVHGSWQTFGMRASTVQPPEMRVNELVPHNTIDACAAIRRTLLDELGGWDEALPFWEDWDLWLRCAARGARTHRVGGVLYEYLVRPGSLSERPLIDTSASLEVLQRIASKNAVVQGAFEDARYGGREADDASQ